MHRYAIRRRAVPVMRKNVDIMPAPRQFRDDRAHVSFRPAVRHVSLSNQRDLQESPRDILTFSVQSVQCSRAQVPISFPSLKSLVSLQALHLST